MTFTWYIPTSLLLNVFMGDKCNVRHVYWKLSELLVMLKTLTLFGERKYLKCHRLAMILFLDSNYYSIVPNCGRVREYRKKIVTIQRDMLVSFFIF